ncbi:MAG: CBS domain-containing protein [archaeon]
MMQTKELIKPCPSLSYTDLASKARAQFRKNNTRAMPVFRGSELVGILTRSDLVKVTSTKSNITVGGLLWKPLIPINSTDSVMTAARTLVQNQIKQAPVFENGKFLGLIRDVDILRAFSQSKRMKVKRKKVSALMDTNITTFSPKDLLSRVWPAMTEHSSFPILNKDELVGIISSRELLENKKSRLGKESEKSRKSASIETVMLNIKGEEARFILKPTHTIHEATSKILKTGTNILPVVDGKLVGLVSRRDLIRGYLQ